MKIKLRTNWSADPETPEGKLITYFNAQGSSKQLFILDSLMAYFYPEIAYINDDLHKEHKLIHRLILLLETRLMMLKKLVGESDSGLAAKHHFEGASVLEKSQSNDVREINTASALEEAPEADLYQDEF